MPEHLSTYQSIKPTTEIPKHTQHASWKPVSDARNQGWNRLSSKQTTEPTLGAPCQDSRVGISGQHSYEQMDLHHRVLTLGIKQQSEIAAGPGPK